MIRIIKLGLCELRWGLFCLCDKTTAILSQVRGKRDSACSQLENRSRMLRCLLQETPWWLRGHLLLGSAELAHQLESKQRPDTGALETVRLSAVAALTLLGKEKASMKAVPDGPPLPKALVQANHLLAMLSSLEQGEERRSAEISIKNT